MADGSFGFNFPAPQRSALRPGEIVVDLFAGGGGASEALKQALGIDPALAYNHDEWAIGMHSANHPLTQHHREDIWHADPRLDVAGRKVGWFHASPDCTHFSQAKGGQPRSRKTRSLSWVVLKWAGQLARIGLAPRIISLENVVQILTWGPLVAKRCKATGRVIKMDGTIAAIGERVPVENQQLIPDKQHAGRTWAQFVAALEGLGYAVEWRKVVASDFGAGTSRTRLFMVARRDGDPIVWPAPTHGTAPGLKPVVSAASSLDFTDQGRSIFDRPRPLADATMRRIAKGVVKHVLRANEPFIVGCGGRMGQTNERGISQPMQTITAKADACLASPVLAPFISEHANASNQRTMSAAEPLRTVCAGVKGGHFAAVSPTLVQMGHGEGATPGKRWSHGINDIQKPIGTIVASGGGHAVASAALVKFRGDSIGTPATDPVPTITSGGGAKRPAGAAHALGLMTAFLEQANGGFYAGGGRDARKPMSTITAAGSQQQLVTAHMATLRNNMTGACADEPLSTIAAQGEHHAVVQCQLSPEHEEGALRVAAFLISYYGNGDALSLREPLDTVTTRDRLGLVTVFVKGMPYVIVDIRLRMLKPAELFRAQGFPPDYIIDRTADGRRITGTAAVRMVGNSVSPPPLAAIARANLDTVRVTERMAA